MPHGPVPVIVRPGAPLVGRLRAPGGGTASQLALVLGLLSIGATTIEGLAESEDALRTARACAALGGRVERLEAGLWRVAGVGVGGLVAPAAPLDCGGSAFSAALLLGAVGGHPLGATIDGDPGARARDMAPVVEPLRRMGAVVAAPAQGCRLPLTLEGPQETIPIVHDISHEIGRGEPERSESPLGVAEIASAVLLAGLNSPGRVTVIVPEAGLDAACGDLLRLSRLFGAQLAVEPHGAGSRAVSLLGQPELRGTRVVLPADPFVAACAVVAALVAPGSDVLVAGVDAARLDAGLLPVLREMGADVAIEAERTESGAPLADLRVRAGALEGIDVPPERAAALRDDVSILAIAAAFAAGETRIRGVHNLRALLDGLAAAGVDHALEGEDLVVRGAGAPPAGGGRIAAGCDPHAAMALAVLGLGAREGMVLDDARPIAATRPTFASLLRGLGANIEEAARWAS